ncbi:MAG: tetratricopeptide repeat protein [Acidobacteria bacterium]|nr:tetratricopeptide repeat protein [Acidobacteriota bacterium]
MNRNFFSHLSTDISFVGSTSHPVLLIVGLLLLLSLGGCLSPKPLTNRPSPQAYVLPEVPLERWGDNTCGAGALSAVMRHHGHPVTEEELVPLLPTGRNGGVVSVDLVIAAQRYGFDADLIRGSEEALRQSLESGKPVITMIRVADLPGVGRDLFHYLVIDGYDPERELYRAQFGDAKARWLSLDSIDSQWSATDYATLLIEPMNEDEDRVSGSPLRRAVRLEEQGRDEEAIRLYRTIIEANPNDATAWINLGNVQTKLGKSAEAEASYRQALAISPGSRDAMNNLAWLLVTERRDLEEAEFLARRASLEPGPDAFLYLDTLGEVLRARGDCDAAIEQFETALFSIPSRQQSFRSPILLNLGQAQIDCGKDAEARVTLEQALDSAPEEEIRVRVESALKGLPVSR